MEEDLVIFETAKLAKEKGFNIEGQVVFDLKNDNKIVNFKDIAIQEFIEDCETGYRDKGLYYFKDGIKRTDYNEDDGYYLLAPTQALLQKWLREVHNIEIAVQWFDNCYIKAVAKKPFKANTYRVEGFQTYEEALEVGLQEALKLIETVKRKK